MMALSRTGTGIVVRMPSRDAAAAGRVLDAGAHGVIFPMVETADDAREAVEACRIFPNGRRSFGPVRASQSFGRDPVAVSEGVSCIVMVETAVGVENIEAIAAVPGVDCIYIGPGDLAITMGLPPGNDPIPGPHADGIEHVRKVATAHGVAVGMPCTTTAQRPGTCGSRVQPAGGRRRHVVAHRPCPAGGRGASPGRLPPLVIVNSPVFRVDFLLQRISSNPVCPISACSGSSRKDGAQR